MFTKAIYFKSIYSNSIFLCPALIDLGHILFARSAKVSTQHQPAEINRHKAEEVFLKNAHAERQEAAQLRREEKRRQEKEKMLNEEDQDKARKLEVNIAILTLYTVFILATCDCPCLPLSDLFVGVDFPKYSGTI